MSYIAPITEEERLKLEQAPVAPAPEAVVEAPAEAPTEAPAATN
jgi:hypothetical protein